MQLVGWKGKKTVRLQGSRLSQLFEGPVSVLPVSVLDQDGPDDNLLFAVGGPPARWSHVGSHLFVELGEG